MNKALMLLLPTFANALNRTPTVKVDHLAASLPQLDLEIWIPSLLKYLRTLPKDFTNGMEVIGLLWVITDLSGLVAHWRHSPQGSKYPKKLNHSFQQNKY